jgi:hypothetical protein
LLRGSGEVGCFLGKAGFIQSVIFMFQWWRKDI